MIDGLRQSSWTIMRSAPLVPVAVGLILGILLDREVHPHIAWYLTVFVTASVAALSTVIRSAAAPLLVLIASGCVGGVLYDTRVRTIPPHSIERLTTDKRQLARIYGTVVSQPRLFLRPKASESQYPFERWTYRSDRTVFLLDVEAIETDDGPTTATGRVRVSVYEPLLDLQENEKVEVFGWLHALYPPRNPGSFDWASYSRRQGIVAQMRCPHRENVRQLDADTPPPKTIATRLRTVARGLLIDDLATGPDERNGLLEAMILGHRSRLDRRLNEIFIRAGCIHFLAVSGFHVAVLMSFVWVVCRCFGLRKHRAAWVMAVVLPVYAIIAEPRAPILRATILGLLFCGALILRRPRAHLNWIAGAALIMLAFNPLDLFDVGFQLSFLAVFGVGYLGVRALAPALMQCAVQVRGVFDRHVLGHPDPEMDREIVTKLEKSATGRFAGLLRALRRLLRAVLTIIAVATGAWLAGAPIVAIFFHRLQPWGFLTSALVFPLVYVVMLFGYAKLLFASLLPPAGALIAGPLAFVESLLIQFVEVLASLPGSNQSISSPPWWLIVSYYTLLVFFTVRFQSRGQIDVIPKEPSAEDDPPRRRWLSGACLVALVCFAGGTATWSVAKKDPPTLRVTVLAVGNGTAVVIELPDGRTVLYDAGSASPYDIGRSVVVPYLRHRGIDRIDRIYISHPNLDHFSGVPSVLDEFDCGPVIINEHFHAGAGPRSPARHFLKLLNARNHPIEIQEAKDNRWSIGDVSFERLWPRVDLGDQFTVNDTSSVLRVTHAGQSILLTGDIGEAAQRELIAMGGLRSDCVMLPHHGGVDPTLGDFLQSVGAKTLIRSSGERMEKSISRLGEIIGQTMLRNTADDGAVTVEISVAGMRVSSVHNKFPQENHDR